MLYAITEGAHNAVLQAQNKKSLHGAWIRKMKNKDELISRYAWGKGNPFFGRLVKTRLVIIGDGEWIKKQRKWKDTSRQLVDIIEKKLGFKTSVYSLNKEAKPDSKPYYLLPLTKEL